MTMHELITFTNENPTCFFATVENIGSYSVLISDFWVNNFLSTNFNVTSGGGTKNFTLGTNENKSFVIESQYNMNYTDDVTIKVRAFEGIENQTTSFVNYTGSLKIDNSSLKLG